MEATKICIFVFVQIMNLIRGYELSIGGDKIDQGHNTFGHYSTLPSMQSSSTTYLPASSSSHLSYLHPSPAHVPYSSLPQPAHVSSHSSGLLPSPQSASYLSPSHSYQYLQPSQVSHVPTVTGFSSYKTPSPSPSRVSYSSSQSSYLPSKPPTYLPESVSHSSFSHQPHYRLPVNSEEVLQDSFYPAPGHFVPSKQIPPDNNFEHPIAADV